MKPGSVIVDMAAEQGGNCELTVPGEVVVRHGVTISATPTWPAAGQPVSQLYGTNLVHLIESCARPRTACIVVDMEDDVVRGIDRRQGRRDHLAAAAVQVPAAPPRAEAAPPRSPRRRRSRPWRSREPSRRHSMVWPASSPAASVLVGAYAPAASWRTSRCSCWPSSSATS